MTRVPATDSPPSADDGPAGALARSRRVILVGAGNIGSRLALELPLLGVRRAVLIDPDAVEERNLLCCRDFGPADVGVPKVEVLAERLRQSHKALDVTALPAALADVALASLRDEEPAVLAGAVDSRRSRYELARVSLLVGLPLVDLAISAAGDEAVARARIT